MSESVITYYSQLEGMAKQAIEKYGGTACVRCTKPTCCWQRLLVYGSEAQAIAEAIRDNEPLKTQLRQWVETFLTLPRAAQLQAEAYFRLRRPCPFLVAGRCGVYENRPTACRLHFSFEDSPDACDPDKVEGGRMVKQLDTLQVHTHFHTIEGTVTFGLGVLAFLEPETLLGRKAFALANYLIQEENDVKLQRARRR